MTVRNSVSVDTGSTTLTNRPADWFTHRVIAGLDYTGDDSRSIEKFAPPAMAALLPASSAGGRIQQTLRHNTIATGDYSGTAKFAVTPSVSSASSLGGQFYRTELNTSQLGGFGFPAPGVETVSAAATATPSTQTQVINTTIGAYVQEMVGWRERLFLTGAVRVDNNSAFGDKFKWVTYPKVSAAWVAFARTGNPNHKGLPTWPTFETTRRATMILNKESKVVDDPNGEERKIVASLRST